MDWHTFLARPRFLPPSQEIVNAVADVTLLITGAGGSIASALALRLAQCEAARMVLLEANENHLDRLQRSLARTGTNARVVFALGSAGDNATLEEIFSAQRPSLVFHAAAHKHVPLLEAQPFAAILNNTFATESLVAAAASHGARVVLLSTDKAVEPTSVMGATKRIAETIVFGSGGIVLRLANVLGSSGGVTEIFQEQITKGGPLTVTDPEARRYFLTMEDSVDLLIAAASSRGSAVLVPAFERDYRIVELARFMLQAIAPGREIPISFTGLRSGEKLVERLWEECESASAGKDNLLLIRSNLPAQAAFAKGLAALRAAADERDLAAALAQLCALVPGYRPSERVLALTQKQVSRVYA